MRYSPEAVNDLEEIWSYISAELHNPNAAKRTVEHIFAALEKLQDYSEMGAPLSSIIGIDSDYRFVVCGSYLAFYRVENTEINVVRVLYARRDYARVLFDNRSDDEERQE